MVATMSTAERFHAVMEGRQPDRLPVVEWASWWGDTLKRWAGEGMPADPRDGHAVTTHFGLDHWWQVWHNPVTGCPWSEPHHGAGILAAAPSYDALEPYVGSCPAERERFAPGFALRATGEAAVWFTFPGFFWGPRTILGIERHLMAFHDEPDLMHRINDRLATWMLGWLDQFDTFGLGMPDFMTFAEDLSYNHGPMLSEKAFNAFLMPYYQRVIPALKRRGIRVLIDSDGDITRCAPWFAAAGIEGVLPLERQAGCEVAQLRRDVPGLRLVGGYDKLVMHRGEGAIRAEFERLLPAMRGGGFMPSCDHQTPPGVAYEQYRTYLRVFREYAVRAVA